MFGIPWWGWVSIVLAVCLALYRLALRAMSSAYRGVVRNYLVGYLQALDADLEVIELTPSHLIANVLGAKRTLELEPLYAGMVDVFAKHAYREQLAVWAFLKQAMPLDSPSLRDGQYRRRILPRVITSAEMSERMEIAPLPHRVLGDTGLACLYVLDGPDIAVTLTDEHFSETGIGSLDTLHEIAVENLSQQFPAESLDIVLKQNEATAFHFNDGYNASRILCIPLMLQDNEAVIALVPDDRSCVLLPVPDDDTRQTVFDVARMQLCDGKPLLQTPVLVTSAGLSAFT